MVNGLISKSTKLFVTLLEGNNDAEISKFLNNSLDFNKLMIKLAREYESFCTDILHVDPLSKIEIIEEKILSSMKKTLLVRIFMFWQNFAKREKSTLILARLVTILKNGFSGLETDR